jgi:hypothetical protein
MVIVCYYHSYIILTLFFPIILTGQTGSGKTFTMGTSDVQGDPVSEGLVPRFISDLFENLKTSQEDEIHSCRIKVSFLEIYGEDVYDLLGGSSKTADRPSLAVREHENGHVFVQGLQEVEVSTAAAALDQLCAGTRNRITGSTAMNAGSSRSHAVYSVTLEQSIASTVSSDDSQRMVFFYIPYNICE